MLGLSEADRPFLREVSDQILVREDGSIQIPQEAMEAMFDLLSYFQADLSRRRASGGDGARVALGLPAYVVKVGHDRGSWSKWGWGATRSISLCRCGLSRIGA